MVCSQESPELADRKTPASPLARNRTVSFQVNDGSDPSNVATSTVTVAAVNDAPVVSAGGTLAYTENQAATPIDGTIAVSDVDSPNLAGATVSITGGFVSSEDVLAFTDQLGITGSYNATTGVLTLTGSASVVNYQTALRSVTYENTSEDPSAANRTVSFRLGFGRRSLLDSPSSPCSLSGWERGRRWHRLKAPRLLRAQSPSIPTARPYSTSRAASSEKYWCATAMSSPRVSR